MPSFESKAHTYRVVTGDMVVLPCEVNNVGTYMQAWKRGIAILTAGSVKVSPDERFRLVDGYNLEIRDVQTQDAGDYVCQIATLQPMEITHTVEILVPPRIHQLTSMEPVEVKKGGPITLECRASGNPVPKITWTRKNNVLPSGEKTYEGSSFTIDRVNRHDAGIYQCTASNNVGHPTTKEIQLKVLFPPEIEVEKSWVHTGEGNEAQLVCIVFAEPGADVVWFKDTLRLASTERRITEVRGSRNTLIIRKVQASDFGNYSCLADNGIGKTKQYLELSGRPNPAKFRSHQQSRSRDSYNISWVVESYTPIEECKLFFRKVPNPNSAQTGTVHYTQPHFGQKRPHRRQENETHGQYGYNGLQRGDWNDVILPNMPSGHYTQHMSYMIRGLEPAVQYEARVQAKNRFGWSQMSEDFLFVTKGIGQYPGDIEPPSSPAVLSEPEMRDMGVKAFGTASQRTVDVLFIAMLLLILADRWF
ncbi:limbic system-associated membrane protein isoform X1 [Cimex lectularius]|uniref:Ig-like domain-containing protein n=1 Tax=Cimex lectularius TaxID=79782 RepID=A0A8I6SSR7_CIMLE|nr:limbic system-associated membrane protein isoform X1 [Cimex lectularius]XP_024084678.1 limbic system-associated membrane protein isoform X1 [Cimex lectularius]